MNLYSVIVPASIVIFYFNIEKVRAQTVSQLKDLSFAENLYIRLSSACRAILDLQFNSLSTQNEILKTMKISILFDNGTIDTFRIDEAYHSLTQPEVFDITRKTKVIIHGFRDNSQSSVSLDIARAYTEKKIFNVLLVDAESMMNGRYILSVHNSRLVAKRLANLLANLEHFGANAGDFHLLGISLGAHIAGWCGKYFHRYKGSSLGQITGLDPAGPCFSYAYHDQRLDKMDAKYVDVLHSNRLVQGVIEPLGHADFYINGGGPQQPGCIMPSCSHLRAAQVYAESIMKPESFMAVRCKNWEQFETNTCEDNKNTVLGFGSLFTTRGLYYLRTSETPPYGLGMNGTKFIGVPNSTWLKNLTYT